MDLKPPVNRPMRCEGVTPSCWHLARNASDLAQARGLLADVRQETYLRSGTVIRGRMNPARLEALTRSEAVLWIEPWRGMKLFD
jgi:hypothetical protein